MAITAFPTARGNIIAASQMPNEVLGIYKRHSFLSLNPSLHHYQNHLRSRPPSTNLLIQLEPIGPKGPRAADSTQPSTVSSPADKTIVPDDQFSLAKVLILILIFFVNTVQTIDDASSLWVFNGVVHHLQVSFGVIGLSVGVTLLG